MMHREEDFGIPLFGETLTWQQSAINDSIGCDGCFIAIKQLTDTWKKTTSDNITDCICLLMFAHVSSLSWLYLFANVDIRTVIPNILLFATRMQICMHIINCAVARSYGMVVRTIRAIYHHQQQSRTLLWMPDNIQASYSKVGTGKQNYLVVESSPRSQCFTNFLIQRKVSRNRKWLIR